MKVNPPKGVRTLARILIVEDEHPINNLIAKSLALTGHTPVCAYDGDTALEIIRSEPPDLAMLDVMLPGLAGFASVHWFFTA